MLRPVRFGASHAMASRGPATAAAGADSLGKKFLEKAMNGDLVSTSVASAACGGSGSVQAAHAATSSARRSVLKRATGCGCLGSAGRSRGEALATNIESQTPGIFSLTPWLSPPRVEIRER